MRIFSGTIGDQQITITVDGLHDHQHVSTKLSEIIQSKIEDEIIKFLNDCYVYDVASRTAAREVYAAYCLHCDKLKLPKSAANRFSRTAGKQYGKMIKMWYSKTGYAVSAFKIKAKVS